MAEEQTGWPVWERSDDGLEGYRLLARYVSPGALDGLALTDTSVVERMVAAGRGPSPADARKMANIETARRLYDNIRARDYPYRIEPWTPAEGQRARHPRWVDQSGGTCLDLAVLYAGLLLDSDVAPLLAVGEGPLEPGAWGHVFVLVDPSRDRAALEPPSLIDDAGAQAFDQRSGPQALDHGLVAVDITRATRPYQWSFDQACTEGARQLGGYSRLVIVDVASLHNSGDSRYEALPTPRAGAAISRRLPPMPPFRDFDSREGLLDKLGAETGPRRVVLYGDPGTGKSMLAHQLAMKADQGCGWFLTATDRSTLITALSDAYLTEANEDGAEGRDNPDREGFALAALQLLRDSTAPWVVVLDNANCPPVDLQGWVPAPHAPGQRVIVTTTHRDWAKEDGFTEGFEVVEALKDPDLAGLLRHDERLLRLARGRPLLAMSFSRLFERLDPGGGTDSVAARLANVPAGENDEYDEMAGPWALWAIAREEIDIDARRAAQALAWLPPDDVPVASALKPLVPGVDRALLQLAGTGVVAFEGAGFATAVVSTHRLYLRAIREHPDDRRAGLDMLDEILATDGTRTLLDEQADQGTINLIAAELLTAYGEAPSGGSVARALRWAARLQELHGAIEESSLSYDAVATRLLVELGETPGEAASGPVDRARDDYDVLADCLHGRARYPFQQSKDPVELRGAYDDCALAVSIKKQLEDELGAARSEALQGLVLRKLAGQAPEDQRVARLEEALAIIAASAATRERLEGGGTAEVARAVYNLGGTRLDLAKRDGVRAAHHLELGTEAYRRSLVIREKVYARKLHPHTAASRNGVGLMALYRALLVEGPGRLGVTEELREATEYVFRALLDREALDGNVDGNDSRKSAELLAKILLARVDVVTPGRAAEVMEELREELADFNRHYRPVQEAT